jgi:hypothetical protein
MTAKTIVFGVVCVLGCAQFPSNSSKPVSLCKQTQASEAVVIGSLLDWGSPTEIEFAAGQTTLVTPVTISFDRALLGSMNSPKSAFIGRQILADGSSDEGRFRVDGQAARGAFMVRTVRGNTVINTPFGFLPFSSGSFTYSGSPEPTVFTEAELAAAIQMYSSATACSD